jgi:hypothetical protein
VEDAIVARAHVKIRRSSGSFETAIIASCSGVTSVVVWSDDLSAIKITIDIGGDRVKWSAGARGKVIDTAVLLELNPWLTGCGS